MENLFLLFLQNQKFVGQSSRRHAILQAANG
jgi:hypothetical protein